VVVVVKFREVVVLKWNIEKDGGILLGYDRLSKELVFV